MGDPVAQPRLIKRPSASKNILLLSGKVNRPQGPPGTVSSLIIFWLPCPLPRVLQACMAGFEVTTVEDALATADIFVTTTGNKDIITAEHMSKMKDQAIVCNIGHFDNEIQVAKLEAMDGVTKEIIKDDTVPGGPVSRFTFPDGKSIFLLAEGRLINLGCATGHPSFVMSNSFTNQTIAQIDIRNNPDRKIGVYRLSKELDEEVARLHLDKLGAKLTTLSNDQADYIGVPVDGPYKPEHYRY